MECVHSMNLQEADLERESVVSGLQNKSMTKSKLPVRHCGCVLHLSEGDTSQDLHRNLKLLQKKKRKITNREVNHTD